MQSWPLTAASAQGAMRTHAGRYWRECASSWQAVIGSRCQGATEIGLGQSPPAQGHLRLARYIALGAPSRTAL